MFVNFVPIYMLLVQDKWPGLKVHVSITTIKHSGKYDLGWTLTCPEHCQLLRTANMQT